MSCFEKGTTSYGVAPKFSSMWRNLKGYLEYVRFQTGPLASNAAEGAGFIRTSPEVTRPDVQYHFCPGKNLHLFVFIFYI